MTDRVARPIKDRLCPRIREWSDAESRKSLDWVTKKGGFDVDEVILCALAVL